MNVAAGDAFRLPVGISFMASAYEEPNLITLASGFEEAAKARKKPEYMATVPTNGHAKRGHGRPAELPATARRPFEHI